MRAVIIDANLLVLLIVGSLDRRQISRHKRTRPYDEEAYDNLVRYLKGFGKIIVTPNVLTETSNLLEKDARALAVFKGLVATLDERYIPSERAVAAPQFERLGLTDAGLLATLATDSVLLTADLDLYLAAIRLKRAAVNFTHLRFGGWQP
jgi:hypothetical protein